MYKGEIVEEGNTKTIFQKAQHPYTRALIACRPGLHTKEERLPTVSDYLNPADKEKMATDFQRSSSILSGEAIVKVENLSVQYPNKTSLLGRPLSFVTAVNHVSFNIYKNETLGLVGESG